MSFDIKKVPMVRVTWLDARDTETGWLDIKDVMSAPLATCQEVGWMVHNGPEKIIGLLDWELSTLSPPFIDLSYWILMLKFEKDWPIAGIGNYNKSLAKSGIPAEETILRPS